MAFFARLLGISTSLWAKVVLFGFCSKGQAMARSDIDLPVDSGLPPLTHNLTHYRKFPETSGYESGLKKSEKYGRKRARK